MVLDAEPTVFNHNIETVKSKINSEFTGANARDVIIASVDAFKQNLIDRGVNVDELVLKIEKDSIAIAKSEAKAKLEKFYNIDKLERHQKILCESEKGKYFDLIDQATEANNGNVITDKKIEETTNLYQIVSNYANSINELKNQMSPIRIYSFKEDGFFGALFNNSLITL